MEDNPTDSPSDSRWISFTELAGGRGISKASASKLVRRRRWRRMTDNQGRVLILVPLDFLSSPSEDTADSPSVISHAISALEAAVTSMTLRAENAEKRADQAENRAQQAESRAVRAESDLVTERNRAELAEKAAEAAQIGQAEAEADAVEARVRLGAAEERAAEVIKAEERRKGQGRWARLRAAWRGE